MEFERGNLVSPAAEVPVIDGEIVTAIRELADRGWGAKAIARELEIARNTVRRYLRHAGAAGHQIRTPRRLTDDVVREVQALYTGDAERNAVVVHRLLREQGRVIGLRTVQRAVAPVRQAQRAADVATVRVETAPGAQLQIDFGEKRVVIGGTAVRVFLLVAVLSYSRRLFVKPFLNERQDDWREGIAAAFVHFGGVTTTILGDNARALVVVHGIGRSFGAFFRRYDLLLSPILAEPPLPLGATDMMGEDLDVYNERLFRLIPFTPQFNAAGGPAMSLPLHWTADGLPVGIQLIAPMWREDLLIRIAAQLEQALPWSDRRPGITALS